MDIDYLLPKNFKISMFLLGDQVVGKPSSDLSDRETKLDLLIWKNVLNRKQEFHF